MCCGAGLHIDLASAPDSVEEWAVVLRRQNLKETSEFKEEPMSSYGTSTRAHFLRKVIVVIAKLSELAVCVVVCVVERVGPQTRSACSPPAKGNE